MENKKRQIIEKAQKTIKLQGAMIERLKTENVSLKERIDKATNIYDNRETRELRSKRSLLTQQKEMLQGHIATEEDLLQKINNDIKVLEKQKSNLQKVRSKIQQGTPSHAYYENKIRRLENSLEQSLKKYNTTVKQNEDLRSIITGLRTDRIMLEKNCNSVVNRNEKLQSKIDNYIQLSIEEHNRRDMNVKQLQILQQQKQQSEKLYEDEYRQLLRIIEENRALDRKGDGDGFRGDGENINGFGLDNEGSDSIRSNGDYDGRDNDEDSNRISMANDNRNMDNVNTPMSATQNIQINQRDYDEKQVDSFGNFPDKYVNDAQYGNRAKSLSETDIKVLFGQIAQHLGIKLTSTTDLSSIIDAVVRTEESNFSLFNFSNELQSEIEAHEKTLSSLKNSLEQAENEKKVKQEQLKEEKSIIERSIMESNAKIVELKESLQDMDKNIEICCKGIEKLYHQLECDTESPGNVISGSCNAQSVMSYLSSCEERVSGIVSFIAALKKRNALSKNISVSLFLPQDELEELMNGILSGTVNMTPAATTLVSTLVSHNVMKGHDSRCATSDSERM